MRSPALAVLLLGAVSRVEAQSAPLEAMYALRYGISTYTEASIFADGRRGVQVPFHWVFYALRYRGTWVVIDPGFDDPRMVQAFHVNWIDPLVLLRRLGIAPADVGLLIITHAHFDHVGLADRFPRARVLINTEARAAVRDPKLAAFLRTPAVQVFDAEVEALPGLRVIRIGGHAPGSSVVRIDGVGESLEITGDEAYLAENWVGPRANGSAEDPAANLRYLTALKREVDAGTVVAWSMHDPTIVPGPDPVRRLR